MGGYVSPPSRVCCAGLLACLSPVVVPLIFWGLYLPGGGLSARFQLFRQSYSKKFLMRAGKISFGLPLPRCTRPGCCLVRSCPGFVPVSKRGSPGIVCKFRQYSAFRFGLSWFALPLKRKPCCFPALYDRHIISARRPPSSGAAALLQIAVRLKNDRVKCPQDRFRKFFR